MGSLSSTLRNWQAIFDRRQAFFLVLALLVAGLAAWPIFSEPGLLNTRGGGDSPFLLQRTHQLQAALLDGHFPARWMPDANYGYGYPFFNFYAPLSIYVTVLFRFWGFDFVTAIKLAQLSAFLLAAWGIFVLSQRWFRSNWAGLLSAVAYTVAPFHLVNVYVRGDSLAEFWAMAFYPLIILAADNLFLPQGESGQRWRMKKTAVLAVAYAGLILSHNISALIFSPFLLLFILLRWWGARGSEIPRIGANDSVHGVHMLLPVFFALLLALGLSAWFFVPALAEQSLATLAPVTAGYFHYSNHFRSVNLIQGTLLFDYGVEGGNAFRMGLAQAVFAVLGAVTALVLIIRGQLEAPMRLLFVLLTLIISTLMITPLSRLLWDQLPLLALVQFPWRFLSIQAFAGALAVGAISFWRGRRLFVPLVCLILLGTSLIGLRTDHLVVGDADVTALGLAQYEWFTGNIGTTVSAEYLPPSVEPRPFSSAWLLSGERNQLNVLEGALLSAHIDKREATQQTWQINAGPNGATVQLPTLLWPGWRAELDSREIHLQPSEGSGLIQLFVPAGAHELSVSLSRTPVRLVAELLSLAALGVLLFLLLWGRPKMPWQWGLIAGLGALLLFLGLRLRPASALPDTDLNWDFAQMGYLHHSIEGIAFEDGSYLNSYAYDREIVQPGDSLTITLTISSATDSLASVSLGTPARAWPVFDPPAPVFAGHSQRLREGENRFQITIPSNTPTGLLAPSFVIDGARPLTPSGQARGELFLRPLRVTNDQPFQEPESPLGARAEGVRANDDVALDVQLAWMTRRALSHNYSVSLRALDLEGHTVAQIDTQPGYGFSPSSAWPAGQWVDDWLSMPWPAGRREPSHLVARLYEAGTGEVVLTRNLGMLEWAGGQPVLGPREPDYELPQVMMPLSAVWEESIELQGYTLQKDGDQLRLTLYWQALADGVEDVVRFVHLFDADSESIVAQADGHPQFDSYPTGQWIAGEIVTDKIELNLEDAPSGDFQVAIGFYRQSDAVSERLSVAGGAEKRELPAARLLLPEIVAH